MAVKPNGVPQKTEPKPLKTGDQLNFHLALRSKKIIDADANQLKEVLRFVMMKIGVRGANLPSEIEKIVLIGHIYDNYGGHTLDEIKLAFDMAIAGKLDVDATCYENFSCLYISNIMNAYRDWSKEEFKETIQEEVLEKKVDKLTLDLEYACYLQKKAVNKLPCLLSDSLKLRNHFK